MASTVSVFKASSLEGAARESDILVRFLKLLIHAVMEKLPGKCQEDFQGRFFRNPQAAGCVSTTG
jgi:hypothetical protein